MLNYIDTVRDSRTGFTKFNQGLDANVLQQTTATAYVQQMQSSQARIELIARVFAETGISAMYKRIYELLQKHSDKSKVVMLRNKWVDVDPASWKKQCDFTVRVGLGNGNRDQNLVHLQSLVAIQEKIIAAGGMGLLVTPKNVFNTLKEIGMNMGLKNIEEYITDPDEGQAQGQQQQEDPEAGKQQVEAMKVQVDMQKLKLEAKKLEIEEEKLKFEEQKLMAEMQMQREENQLKSAEMQMEALTDRAVKLGS